MNVVHHFGPRLVLAAFSLFVASPSSLAITLYQTGFEAPVFSTGSLVGQDGWGGFGDLIGDTAANVMSVGASEGSNAVRVKSSEWGQDGPFAIYAPTPLNFDPLAMGTPMVRLSADIRLDGPQTGPPIDGDFISANLVTRIGPGGQGGIFSLILSSDSNAYAFGSRGAAESYLFQTPAALGKYHSLAMQLDFAAGTTSYFLDDQIMGTLSFRTDVPTNFFRRGNLAFQGVDSSFAYDPTAYTAYFDRYQVTAVPEPTTISLFAFGLMVICAGWRRTMRTPSMR